MVRFKNRYLLVEFIFPNDFSNWNGPKSPPHFTEANLTTILRESIQVNFGDIGASNVGSALNVKYLSPHTRIAIIRTSRLSHSLVWQALTFIRQIKGVECCARVIHVGGTIRKTQQVAIRHDRLLILGRNAKLKQQQQQQQQENQQQQQDLDKQLQESEKFIMSLEP